MSFKLVSDFCLGGLFGTIVLYVRIGRVGGGDDSLLNKGIVKNCRSPEFNDWVDLLWRTGAGGRGGTSFLITAYL